MHSVHGNLKNRKITAKFFTAHMNVINCSRVSIFASFNCSHKPSTVDS